MYRDEPRQADLEGDRHGKNQENHVLVHGHGVCRHADLVWNDRPCGRGHTFIPYRAGDGQDAAVRVVHGGELHRNRPMEDVRDLRVCHSLVGNEDRR